MSEQALNVVPSDLFVFAGAGLSIPSGLPSFNSLRDRALADLRMGPYLSGGDRRFVAEGIDPEAFMSALHRAHIDVTAWLRSNLGVGSPNSGHRTLAELVHSGAAVWTLNFDELVEQASGDRALIDVNAWPEAPSLRSALNKPHGTLSGRVIATSEETLVSVSGQWRDRFMADTDGRTILLVGYSARDLDLQELWRSAFTHCQSVVWFERGDEDRNLREELLRPLLDKGLARFVLGDNPTRDFVQWCIDNRCVDIDVLAGNDFDAPPPDGGLAIPFDSFVAARFCEVLGDSRLAVRKYVAAAPRNPVEAARRVVDLRLNHGGRLTTTFLSLARPLLKPFASNSSNERLRRKELAIRANLGQADWVLAATEDYESEPVSNYAILRAAAMRSVGDLDESARIARDALAKARAENHPVRSANAGFQYAQSLVWAFRLAEASGFLNGPYELLARKSAARWVSWRQVLLGSVLGYLDPDAAVDHLRTARRRFLAEGLLDGVAATLQSEVSVLRGLSQGIHAQRVLSELRALHRRRGVFYLRRNERMMSWIEFEHAELARDRGDREEAMRSFRRLSESRYPVIASFGHLGIACLQMEDGSSYDEHSRIAKYLADAIHARYQSMRADRLLEASAAATDPLIFP